jgi:hypothetical protein
MLSVYNSSAATRGDSQTVALQELMKEEKADESNVCRSTPSSKAKGKQKAKDDLPEQTCICRDCV